MMISLALNDVYVTLHSETSNEVPPPRRPGRSCCTNLCVSVGINSRFAATYFSVSVSAKIGGGEGAYFLFLETGVGRKS